MLTVTAKQTSGQVNFLLPSGLAFGIASASVTRNGEVVAQGLVEITPVAPALFTANADGKGAPAAVVLRVKPDPTQSSEPAYRCGDTPGSCTPAPIDLGAGPDQVFLLLFGTGLRGCRSVPFVQIGGVQASAAAAVAQGQFAGLDQVNVLLPPALAGRGDVELSLEACGSPANPVRIHVR